MIDCRNIQKAYGQETVLQDLSCTFPDTGFFLLLGESGSGKTTFLNLLAGLLPFDQGSIQVDGRTFTGQVDPGVMEILADYITQDAFFVDFLTVGDNLRLVLEDDEKIGRLLMEFCLQDQEKQMPATLSGGERQRLALVRALLGGKRILLLDEPTAALDEANKTAVFQMLSVLSRRVLIICSTHDTQAAAYADGVIPFPKVRPRGNPKPRQCGPAAPGAVKRVGGKKKNLNRYLRQWFHSPYRSRKSSILFVCFLVLAMLLCIYSDLPGRKQAATARNYYRLNMLGIQTLGHTTWQSLGLDENGVAERVLEYAGSCPDGNEELPVEVVMRPAPPYEMTLYTLPGSREAFALSDSLAYGSYFTGKDQIILSWEMANALDPGDPEALLGESMRVCVYSLGNVDLQIVGIFHRFTDREKKYLQALDIFIQEDREYDPENYTSLYFVNAELIGQLEDDPEFFMGSGGQRHYRLYFDSYRDMSDYYQKHAAQLEANRQVIVEPCTYHLRLEETFTFAFYTVLPVTVFLGVFAVAFFTALKKAEFMRGSRFVAVFVYAGFSQKQVLSRFVALNIWEMAKLSGLSLGIAVALAMLGNRLNQRFGFVNFQIFSFSPWMIGIFLLLILVSSGVMCSWMLRRVRLRSWYETILDTRDLL